MAMDTVEQATMRRRLLTELEESGGFVVSTAILRAQDLLPVFLTTLGILDPGRQRELCEGFPIGVRSFPDHPWWQSEECACLLNEDVFDALNEAAPEGYWFGASEGDGACFGFWKCEEDE